MTWCAHKSATMLFAHYIMCTHLKMHSNDMFQVRFTLFFAVMMMMMLFMGMMLATDIGDGRPFDLWTFLATELTRHKFVFNFFFVFAYLSTDNWCMQNCIAFRISKYQCITKMTSEWHMISDFFASSLLVVSLSIFIWFSGSFQEG